VVRYNELEGGFFAIRGSDDVTYDPTNLPARPAHHGAQATLDFPEAGEVAGRGSCNWFFGSVMLRSLGCTASGGQRPRRRLS
jgi:hypothetical protein